MNYVWDLNLQPFIKSPTVVDYALCVGFEPTAFKKSTVMVDNSLLVGFEPISFQFPAHIFKH